MNKKNLFIFLLFICSISFDFLRDYIFQNINFQLFYLSHFIDGLATITNMTDSRIESLIGNLSISNLKFIKWGLTLFFILVYLLITILISKLIFKEKEYRLFIFTTLFFSLISLLFFVLYISTKSLTLSYSYYYISIEISHFLQSSLFVVSMLMIFKVYLLFKAAANK